MTKLYFDEYKDGTEGKMARMETFQYKIPVNIHAEKGSDFSLSKDTLCEVEIFADEDEIYIYKDEEEYRKLEKQVAPIAMIPIGTFDTTPDGKPIKESPFVIFSGKVLQVEYNDKAENDEPVCCLRIESYDMNMNLFSWHQGKIEPGYYVHGMAWLYGTIKPIEE